MTAERAYYVERKARTVTTLLVFAASADEALQLAKLGDCEAIDSISYPNGFGRPRRASAEDREPPTPGEGARS